MAQQIKLNIRRDITKLAGNKYGKVIYQTQVRDNINLDEEVVFIIPEQIDRAASSFVQGFPAFSVCGGLTLSAFAFKCFSTVWNARTTST